MIEAIQSSHHQQRHKAAAVCPYVDFQKNNPGSFSAAAGWRDTKGEVYTSHNSSRVEAIDDLVRATAEEYQQIIG